jgi:hypothetical protein
LSQLKFSLLAFEVACEWELLLRRIPLRIVCTTCDASGDFKISLLRGNEEYILCSLLDHMWPVPTAVEATYCIASGSGSIVSDFVLLTYWMTSS